MTRRKTLGIPCRLPDARSTDRAVNLRQCADRLEPVGQPSIIESSPSESAWPLADGEYLCVATDSRTLRVVTDTSIYTAGTMPDRVTAFARAASGALWVLSHSGPRMLSRHKTTGRYTLSGPLPDFGAVRLEATEGSEFSAIVAPELLAGTYSRGEGVLTPADSETAGAAMLRAASLITTAASLAGDGMQPRLMAWQLRDSTGQIIFRSTPQWLGSETGFALAGGFRTGVSAEEGGFRRIDPFTASARSWRLRVTIQADAITADWVDLCSSLEIIAGRPMDFTEGHTASPAHIYTPVGTAKPEILMYMPGASRALATDTEALSALAAASLARFHSEARVVARIAAPFATPGSRFLPIGTPEQEAVAADALPHELALPHRWTAAESMQSGMATFHADITAIPTAGARPHELAATLNSQPSTLNQEQTVITLTDGTRLASAKATSALLPASLPPMLIVPTGRASRLTLQVGDTAITLPLTPSACGRYSYHITADLRRLDWNPSPNPWAEATTTATATRHPGTILCAGADSPLNPVSAHTVCTGTIRRLTQAIGAGGGWNHARQHIIAWATDGIYSLSVPANLRSPGSALLHTPGVLRRDSVATTPEAAYAALSSGTLLRFTGSRARTVPCPVSALALGWNQHRRELWVTSDQGHLCIITENGGIYHRTEPRITSFCPDHNGRLTLLDHRRQLLDATAEQPAADVDIAWTQTIEANLHPCATATWLIDAESARLTLSLLAHSGGTPAPLTTLTVSGQINAPLTARVYAPARHWLTATITGTLTGALHSVTIN